MKKKLKLESGVFTMSTPQIIQTQHLTKPTTLVPFSNLFIVSMASMNPMILSFAESGLATFIRLYAEIHAEGIQGPEPSKLHEFMRSKLNELEEVTEPIKRVQEDVPVSLQPEGPKETVAASEPVQKKPDPQATAPKKVDVRDLKKLTYKKKRSVTKGKNAGEEIEEEILVELPYLPHCVDYSSGCQALKLNGGLLNPCLTRPCKNSTFCKACGETPKFGTIGDRQSVEFGSYCVSVARLDSKTKEKKESVKKEVSYGTWLEKQKLERSFVEKLLVDHGLGEISIPESCYAVKKTKKRNSVKKSPSTSSDGETSSFEEDASSVEQEASEVADENVSVEQEAPEVVENVSVEPEVPVEPEAPVEPEVPVEAEQPVVEASVQDVGEKKKRGRPKKETSDKEPVDPNAPKKKRGRPKKESKPILDGDEEEDVDNMSVSSQDLYDSVGSLQDRNVVIMKEPPAPKEDEEEDDDPPVYFDYNGISYCYDNEYTIFLIEDGALENVGTWDPQENEPVWNHGYEP